MSSVCVIGAGPSGLTAIKACLEEGLQPTCFEAQPAAGGLWRFDDSPDAHSSVYRSTVINTSKEMMAFSDWPVPATEAMYMRHEGVLRYLRSYADKFDLDRHITFGARVVTAEPVADGAGWEVTVSVDGGTPQMRTFDYLMVCTGHHSSPRTPAFPGADTFEGRQLHSHAYKDHRGFEDQRVVVVGLGNSAADIAVELSRHAAETVVSTRSGAWVMERTGLFGVPLDHIGSRFLDRWLPLKGLQWLFRLTHALRWGDISRFGLRPAHGIFGAHPTVNSDLIPQIRTGALTVRGNVSRLSGRTVEFEDGSAPMEDVDAVVYATGYDISFPFLPSVDTTDNVVRLYKHVFAPEHGGSLAFIGNVQQIGALPPVAEMQARWAARVFSGAVSLPPVAEQHAEIERRLTIDKYIWKPSARHTIQVFASSYMEDLAGAIGALPELDGLWRKDFTLWAYLTFGPHLAVQYRLRGPHACDGAREALVRVLDTRYPLSKSTFMSDVVLPWFLVLGCSLVAVVAWVVWVVWLLLELLD